MASTTDNVFTRRFKLDHPIVQGPMGGAAGPALVAAVANAGALGILPVWTLAPEQARQALRSTRSLTDKAFGVNLRADLLQFDLIKLALDEGIDIVHLFWGDPAPSVAPIRAARARLIVTVGDVEDAKRALDAGADALIAQGIEAGGHVIGETPLEKLLELVLPLAGETPVIAAGGLADAADVAQVMQFGAAGALLGTRFVATRESMAHDEYKKALLAAGPDTTARSLCFDGMWPDAPHRTLANSTWRAWVAAGEPPQGERPGEGDILLREGSFEAPRYSAMPPSQGMTGNIEATAMYAGTGVDRITDCPAAGEVVERLVARISPSATA